MVVEVRPPQSARRGRVLIFTAAILWSLSGFFVPLLRNDTGLGLNIPEVKTWHIAFYRVFFAGLALVPTLRRRDLTFRPAMIFTAVSFAVMNGLLMRAMSLGKTADAILLQYTAPMWTFLAGVVWFGEPADRRSLLSVLIALVGVGSIVVGGWSGDQLGIVLLALGSGTAYALVLVGLKTLRDASPAWLTVLNHLTAAFVLLPVVFMIDRPTIPQMICLAIFGAVQMALPYWLMARGLRSVSTQEAGAITLLEPLLNGLWAYLIAPEAQKPTTYTLVGGAFILGALLFRYAPFCRR